MGGRVFLILVLGVAAATFLTWWLAFGERQRMIGQFRENRALEQAEQFILTLDAIPPAGRQVFMATARRFGLKGELENETSAPAGAVQAETPFMQALGERLGKDFQLSSLPTRQFECGPMRERRADSPPRMVRGVCETVAVRLRDGSGARVTVLPPRPLPPPRGDFLYYLALFLAIIGILAFAVSRMTMRPLNRLAQAAEDIGKDIDHPPLPERGATELRQAAAAFNAMQARIRDHIRQRTQMLAAITHDLQTPLTRLRLRLEKVTDTELREKLIEDLSQTQAIVREGLDLARSIDVAEALQALDLDSLLDSVCTDAVEAGQAVTLEGKTGVRIMARPVALRRCLINLIDNAVKYGQRAEVSARKEGIDGAMFVRVRIRDHGPGIPQEEMQKVFEPFYRLESSRSRQTGGTGLGLTIARNVAQQHGGSIALTNLDDGGLEVVLTLRIQATV
ncbi:MAG: HAMP domain-containing protein [Burkholderiales bacterium]|nr:HAMP domain-containing protein [Burkholderiales bacterium]